MHSGKYVARIGWVVGSVFAVAVYACGGSAETPGNSDAVADGAVDDATLDGSHRAIDGGATADATLGDTSDALVEGDAGASGEASADATDGSFDAALDGHADASGDEGGGGDALAEAAVDARADASGDAASTAVVCTGPCTGTIFDGGCVETLATGQPIPQGIATDGINVYWTDNPPLSPDAGAVMRVSVCGGTPVAIASGPISPQFVAVDDTNLYWTQSSSVVAWNKSTGAISTLAYNQAFPAGIVVDSANLYWANDVADGGLMRMPLDGGAPTEIVYAPNPYRLVLSPTTVYWVEPFTSFILFAPRTGGARATFYYDTNYEVADLAIDDNNLYYTEKSSLGPVEVLPLDGGAKSMLTRDNGTQGVVSDGTYVYYASANGGSAVDGEIVRVPIDGGAPTVLATGGFPEEIAIDATSVYWTSSRSQIIGKVSPR